MVSRVDLSEARGRLPGRPNLRPQRTLLLSGLTGVVTGVGVAGFEWVTATQLFEHVVEAPLALQAAALAVGLLVAFASLAWLAGGASSGTADEYIRNFHQPERLSMRPVAGRMLAGVATLGSGGSLGFEGPSLYLGAVVGTAIQTRWSRLFSRDDSKVLMVAGAAAGVAAIFKAPATGAVFALEVPFRDDTARRALLPALVGAASGYLTYVAIIGTAPLFRIDGAPPFDLRELGGAILLGLLCGVGARGFAWVVGTAKRLATRGHPLVRIGGASGVLIALMLLSNALTGESLSTGSGYRILEWVTEDRSLWLIIALLAIRTLATGATLSGGGVGVSSSRWSSQERSSVMRHRRRWVTRPTSSRSSGWRRSWEPATELLWPVWCSSPRPPGGPASSSPAFWPPSLRSS